MSPTASRESPQDREPRHADQAATSGTGSRATAKWRWAAGLAALAALAWGTWALNPGRAHTFTTGIGEQRTVRLSDGSLLQINTNSRVRVSFTGQRRDLDLVYGEALFGVEHDPARPFRVRAGSTVVQAIGTRFNVYYRENTTTVAVLEGLVQISPEARRKATARVTAESESRSQASPPVRLAAGRQAQVAETGRVLKLEDVDASRAVAWRERRLMFDKDTLGDISEQFNRYNVSPRILVRDAAAREKRYTGVFDADDPFSLLEYLSRDPSLRIERHAEQIVIRDSREPPER